MGSLHLLPEQGQMRAQLYSLQGVVEEKELPEGGWEIVIDITNNQWEKLCRQYKVEMKR